MSTHTLGIKVGVTSLWGHDPSAVLFEDGELVFGVEEERYTREKHAVHTFPKNAIRACLDFADISLGDVDEIAIPYDPTLATKRAKHDLLTSIRQGQSISSKFYQAGKSIIKTVKFRGFLIEQVANRLRSIGDPLPSITTWSHHRCHAVSAYYPAPFENGLIVTIDGAGEYDSTVVWRADGGELQRVRTYEYPNSLGTLYGVVTEYLGYRANNGEGKVMGLAPYGEFDEEIEEHLRNLIKTGVDYDVTRLLSSGFSQGVKRLEEQLGQPRRDPGAEFTQWHKNLAHTTQRMLEETVTSIVEHYCQEIGETNVGVAGGVALNCKMNKQVMELPTVDTLYVQPVAHDAGVALGAGMLASEGTDCAMPTVYFGPSYSSDEVEAQLETFKLDYSQPDDLCRSVASHIADGKLVGWFQSRLEFGPRALGNRSILADPRSVESRDRVNRFVKNREEWRPFAPSLREDEMDEYLVNAERAPYMIKTFDVRDEKKDEIPAVIHAGDETTRPQTVTKQQNPRYYDLLTEFKDITGVPVLLNTSFNDHAEPIVTKPKEAIKDFFAMGLDVLVVEDFLIEK